MAATNADSHAGSGNNAGDGVNSSSFAGFVLGVGVAVAGLAGLAILAPMPTSVAPDTAVAPAEHAPIAAEPVITDPPRITPEEDAPPPPLSQVDVAPAPDTPEQGVSAETVPTVDPPRIPQPETAADAPAIGSEAQTADATDSPEAGAPPRAELAQPRVPGLQDPPDIGTAPDADVAPAAPQDIVPPATAPRLPALPQLHDDGGALPSIAALDAAPETGPETAPETVPAVREPIVTLPGTPVPAMPGRPQLARDDSAQDSTVDEAAAADALPALLRNATPVTPEPGAALMGLVLHDPGLPTPLRRQLAARDINFSVALNPMDPGAAAAAQLYREAGKEVLIFANGVPLGAGASDLDVTFSTFFETLPQAVAVMDPPAGGFTRNSALLQGVLPLLARDGHGLVSFAGGTGQAARSAAANDVPHAEVFRVLDASEESPFTIRRFLDRAVFQASQVGYAIVFGDASNDAMLDAIDLWLEMGRVDDVSLVPISAILLRR